MKEECPTKETIQKTMDAAEPTKEQIKERLDTLEAGLERMETMLIEHKKRIDICSIQR